MPRYESCDQKIFSTWVEADASKATMMLHSAAASITNESGSAPGFDLRSHRIQNNSTDSAAATIKA